MSLESALVARALKSGPLPCFFMSVGMVLSEVLYLLLACLGLAAVAEKWGIFLSLFA